jgi:hypothetical protein
MDEAKGVIRGFSEGVDTMATKLGLAFGVREVSNFALEITKLAGQADGVRQAFEKIQGSVAVLQQMRAATQGTVADLELMKSAVQASNFGIPIQQLGALFQFAYERAKATGQSVDYLVNSIVVGIGRKSPLILDNLGISAVQLKEKLGGVSTEAASIGQVAEAVGKIAQQALDETGKSAVTAAEKLQRVSATWENIKEELGKGIADHIATDDPNSLLTNFQNQLKVWGDENISFWDKATSSAQEYAEMVRQITLEQTMAASSAAFTKPSDLTGNLAPTTADPLLKKMQDAIDKMPGNAGKAGGGVGIDASAEMATLATGAANWIEGMKQSAASLESEIIGPLENVAEFQKEITASVTDYEKEQYQEQLDAFQAAQEAKTKMAADMGKQIGANFGLAASGVISFEQAMKRATLGIVNDLLQQSMAGLYARIFETVPFPFNVGLIAAGQAFVSSLFAGLASGGGSSGGGGSSVPPSVRNNPAVMQGNTQSVSITGRTIIEGNKLAVVFGRAQEVNSYTRPVFAGG